MSIRTTVSAATGRVAFAGRAAALLTCLALPAASSWAQTQPTAATTTYSYDAGGNKTSQTDALNRTTHWAYDALDRVTSRQLPDGTRESSTYDAAGNLVAKTTFAGERLSFQYDAQDRLTGQVIPAGTGSNQGVPAGTAIFRYTPTGMLASRSEQGPTTLAGEQTFRYDAQDRLVEVKGPTGQINYGRDAAGNVIQRSVAGAGTAHYEYDDAGRMTRVVAPDGKQTHYGYDAAGRLERVERELNLHEGQPQALITSYSYDSADRVTLIGHLRQRGSALALIAGQRLSRAAGGTIIRIETDRGDGSSSTDGQIGGRVDAIQDFEYDALGRLTRENRTTTAGGNVDTRYEYDVVGNRTRKTVATAAGTEITTYTYDVADRLTQEVTSLPAGGSRAVTYTWDGNGNLASKTEPGKVTLYRFDPLNRLIDIRQGPTAPEAEAANAYVRYGYDAEGHRVRKWSGTESWIYLIDHEEAFAQIVVEAGPAKNTNYLRGIGLIRQQDKSAQSTRDLFPVAGHMGSTLAAVNASGEVVEELLSDAFGTLDSGTAVQLLHQHAGEFWDAEAKLVYLRARWYDPALAGFLSPDPFEGRQRDPRSFNRYVYAYNDPVNRADPDGRMSLTETAVGLAAIGALGIAAYHQTSANALYAPPPDHTSRPPFSLTALLLTPAVKLGAERARTDAERLAEGLEDEPEDNGHLHHTIPIYLCGAPNQRPFMARLPTRVHKRLHKEMAAFSILTEGALELGLAMLPPQLQLTWRGKNRLLVHQMAAYPAGRAAIAQGLKEFYDYRGYSPMGLPPESVTIQAGLMGATPSYVEGTNTSIYVGCRRPRTLK